MQSADLVSGLWPALYVHLCAHIWIGCAYLRRRRARRVARAASGDLAELVAGMRDLEAAGQASIVTAYLRAALAPRSDERGGGRG